MSEADPAYKTKENRAKRPRETNQKYFYGITELGCVTIVKVNHHLKNTIDLILSLYLLDSLL